MDGQNDFGEDQHVTFTEDGAVTGDLVKIQVKGWPFVAQGRPSARRSGEVLKTITISPDRKLDDQSITDFVAEVRRYLSRYRATGSSRPSWARWRASNSVRRTSCSTV